MIRQAEFGKIFAAHGGIDDLDIVVAKRLFQTAAMRFVSSGLLYIAGVNSSFSLYDRLEVLRNSGRYRASFRDAFDRGEHAFAHFGFVGAHGQLHFHFVRNDVALRSAVNGADCDDNRIEWIVFAARDGLPAR